MSWITLGIKGLGVAKTSKDWTAGAQATDDETKIISYTSAAFATAGTAAAVGVEYFTPDVFKASTDAYKDFFKADAVLKDAETGAYKPVTDAMREAGSEAKLATTAGDLARANEEIGTAEGEIAAALAKSTAADKAAEEAAAKAAGESSIFESVLNFFGGTSSAKVAEEAAQAEAAAAEKAIQEAAGKKVSALVAKETAGEADALALEAAEALAQAEAKDAYANPASPTYILDLAGIMLTIIDVSFCGFGTPSKGTEFTTGANFFRDTHDLINSAANNYWTGSAATAYNQLRQQTLDAVQTAHEIDTNAAAIIKPHYDYVQNCHITNNSCAAAMILGIPVALSILATVQPTLPNGWAACQNFQLALVAASSVAVEEAIRRCVADTGRLAGELKKSNTDYSNATNTINGLADSTQWTSYESIYSSGIYATPNPDAVATDYQELEQLSQDWANASPPALNAVSATKNMYTLVKTRDGEVSDSANTQMKTTNENRQAMGNAISALCLAVAQGLKTAATSYTKQDDAGQRELEKADTFD